MAQRAAKIMGILNVTPDSFSDDGRFFTLQKAVQRGLALLEEGADILDIGGEASGPGSVDVSVQEELRRVIPVIKKIIHLRPRAVISVDTYKAPVARQAIAAGARIINDITALRGDPEMTEVIAQTGTLVVLMYSKDPTPRTTRIKKRYRDVMQTIKDFLKERIGFAFRSGIKKNRIILDPGMGAFVSAIPKYSYEILERLAQLKPLGCPILVGASRKSFLPGAVGQRFEPTLATHLIAVQNGADIIRVHEVLAHRRMLETWQRLARVTMKL